MREQLGGVRGGRVRIIRGEEEDGLTWCFLIRRRGGSVNTLCLCFHDVH